MSTETIALELPVSLYAELEDLANEINRDPVAVIATWIEEARQRREWQHGWAELHSQVQQGGGFREGETEDEIVALTRRARQEIFEAEYAHLYR